MKVKDLREIAKPQGLRGYSRPKKSEEKCDFSVEVSEDDCEDLPDCESSYFEKDNFSVKVFKKDNFTIKVCEDVCEDLPDCESSYFKKDNFTIKVCEDVCEDFSDGW